MGIEQVAIAAAARVALAAFLGMVWAIFLGGR
jgi:hypothetical protein